MGNSHSHSSRSDEFRILLPIKTIPTVKFILRAKISVSSSYRLRSLLTEMSKYLIYLNSKTRTLEQIIRICISKTFWAYDYYYNICIEYYNRTLNPSISNRNTPNAKHSICSKHSFELEINWNLEFEKCCTCCSIFNPDFEWDLCAQCQCGKSIKQHFFHYDQFISSKWGTNQI